MEDRLQALEARVVELAAAVARLTQREKGNEGTTLQAPLRIVSSAGAPLLEVHEGLHDVSLRLFNAHGHRVATLGVDGTQAGYLTIHNADGQVIATLDVELSGARLQLYDHAHRGGVVLFGGDSGDDAGGGLHILHTGTGVSISLWATATEGQIQIYDAQTDALLLSLPEHPGSPERMGGSKGEG